MSYPIKAHTLPLLESILSTPGLAGHVQAFIDSRGGKTDDFHDYLVSVEANEPLYNLIYDILGTCDSPDYATPFPEAAVKAYITGCMKGPWNSIILQNTNPPLDFRQISPEMGDYLMCQHTRSMQADERIIINFCIQDIAIEFLDQLKDHVGAETGFKVLLAYDHNRFDSVNKNDKVVIYYPKAQRGVILSEIDRINPAALQDSVSGFYLQVKPGVGIAAETEPTWSFTMYTAEYCMKYLVNHSPAGKESTTPATAAGMYDYVVRRLLKNGRIPESLAEPADLPVTE